jgi:hypothetical protein
MLAAGVVKVVELEISKARPFGWCIGDEIKAARCACLVRNRPNSVTGNLT